MGARARELLVGAKTRLDTLDWYPRPVKTGPVALVSAPWLFQLPWLRRFHGYATLGVIFVRRPLLEVSEDLVTHELCHVWQMQHHPLRMPLSYLRFGYRRNPFEIQARQAVALTAGTAPRAAGNQRV
jgi:hypothetical protein